MTASFSYTRLMIRVFKYWLSLPHILIDCIIIYMICSRISVSYHIIYKLLDNLLINELNQRSNESNPFTAFRLYWGWRE